MPATATSMPFLAGERPIRKAKVHATAQPLTSALDGEAARLSTAVARGDDAAFRELYDRYHHRVFRLAASLGHGDETLARELVQAVMLTAAAKLKPVATEDHLWNWLARVTRQKVAKARRSAGRDTLLVNVPELPETAVAPNPVREERLDAALLALDESERRLVEGFYFDGLTHRQLARRLGATPKAISSRLERARARLRAWLNRKDSDET